MSGSVLKHILVKSQDISVTINKDPKNLLDLRLHIIDSVTYDSGDGFASPGLHKDLHSTTKTENKMKGGFLLNVIIRKSGAKWACQ
jgi:hypothetical protein